MISFSGILSEYFLVLRLVMIAGGICMMIPGTLTDIIGLALVGAVVAFQFMTKKRGSAAAA